MGLGWYIGRRNWSKMIMNKYTAIRLESNKWLTKPKKNKANEACKPNVKKKEKKRGGNDETNQPSIWWIFWMRCKYSTNNELNVCDFSSHLHTANGTNTHTQTHINQPFSPFDPLQPSIVPPFFFSIDRFCTLFCPSFLHSNQIAFVFPN